MVGKKMPETYDGMRDLFLRAVTHAVGGQEKVDLWVQHEVKGIPVRMLARERNRHYGTVSRQLQSVRKRLRAIMGD